MGLQLQGLKGKRLYKFKILSVDSGLLLNEADKERVIEVLSTLKNYNLSLYFVVQNMQEKKQAEKFIKVYKLCAEIIKVNSPVDKANKLLSLVKPRSETKIQKKINAGKKIFHLGKRKSRFIDVFESPEGVVCHDFYKLVWGSQCPFDCSYCFLQLTYRIYPYIQQYLNFDDLFKEMKRLNERVDKPVILNTGELSDSLALDHITNITNKIIKKSLEFENIRLLLLSKSNQVNHLDSVPPGKAICSMSLNIPGNINKFERGTASVTERIEALKNAEKKGYEIRCRIDPIITWSENWEKAYNNLIKNLFARVSPQIVTLGQPRFYPMLLNIIKKRNPEAGEYFAEDSVLSAGKRKRVSDEQRFKIYKKLIEMVEKYGSTDIALCKEDPKLHRDLNINQISCNCI